MNIFYKILEELAPTKLTIKDIRSYWKQFTEDIEKARKTPIEEPIDGVKVVKVGKDVILDVEGQGIMHPAFFLVCRDWGAISYDDETGTWRVALDEEREIKRGKSLKRERFAFSDHLLTRFWEYFMAMEASKMRHLQELENQNETQDSEK